MRCDLIPYYVGSVHMRRGLVEKFRFRGWRIQGSKPDSTEDKMGLMQAKSERRRSNVLSVVWKRRYQLMCRPCHLTAVQNYEVSPKVALVLLQNGILIQLN
ncbi:hypothetical protein AVEN_137510-1 [Araneus ventricosus]|uniref:Uncharacterized protein n=1 Tax=Araneus ventricosus TaxID=182803 RepID=A0A4Y2QG16_ARAVE|nr:hypothetical protein AVEN_137510-1 [Araneus ventricosus]